MISLKYPILQSGFIDLNEQGLTKQIPEQPTFSDTILFIQKNHEYDNLYYSEDVTKLFVEWQSNFNVMARFDFKVRVLELAMKRFGPNMLEWMAFQSMKPGFTNTHKQFLLKMCMWLTPSFEAPSESSEAIRWLGLLGPDQGNNIAFNVMQTPAGELPSTTAQCVQNWVMKEAGFEALMVYMYVIFGQRVGHTQKPGM